jgi:hypothetical protein
VRGACALRSPRRARRYRGSRRALRASSTPARSSPDDPPRAHEECLPLRQGKRQRRGFRTQRRNSRR